ncbi:hypothetical protein BDV97DRAFT_345922 [Delphinella strobiligena]|nr:hypothetical protein BDV97DRAFT_345922 [Delphinella strobiligena]
MGCLALFLSPCRWARARWQRMSKGTSISQKVVISHDFLHFHEILQEVMSRSFGWAAKGDVLGAQQDSSTL